MVSFTDALNYVAYKNPVSQFTIASVSQLAKASVSRAKLLRKFYFQNEMQFNFKFYWIP